MSDSRKRWMWVLMAEATMFVLLVGVSFFGRIHTGLGAHGVLLEGGFLVDRRATGVSWTHTEGAVDIQVGPVVYFVQWW